MLPVLLRRRDSSEQGGRGALCVRRAGGERAGVELLLGAQERSLSVNVPAGVAFEGEEDVLCPAVHDAVQKPLGSCCQSLGKTTGEMRALVSASTTQHSAALYQAVKPGTLRPASHLQHGFIHLHPQVIEESHSYFNNLC